MFEKAYAKLAGSYAAVEFGSEDDGLVSLTGVTELVCLHVVLVCAQTSCEFGCEHCGLLNHAFGSPKTSACIIMETHTHIRACVGTQPQAVPSVACMMRRRTC